MRGQGGRVRFWAHHGQRRQQSQPTALTFIRGLHSGCSCFSCALSWLKGWRNPGIQGGRGVVGASPQSGQEEWMPSWLSGWKQCCSAKGVSCGKLQSEEAKGERWGAWPKTTTLQQPCDCIGLSVSDGLAPIPGWIAELLPRQFFKKC